jgi:hypothetical protein
MVINGRICLAPIMGVQTYNEAVRKIIGVYDDAYAGLVERKDPAQFRDFLLSAPSGSSTARANTMAPTMLAMRAKCEANSQVPATSSR